MAVVEAALLVSLTSSDTWVSQMSARGLNDIVLAEQIADVEGDNDSEDDRAKRYPVYSQLGDYRALAVGMNSCLQSKHAIYDLCILSYV